jgi:hypothetical protein
VARLAVEWKLAFEDKVKLEGRLWCSSEGNCSELPYGLEAEEVALESWISSQLKIDGFSSRQSLTIQVIFTCLCLNSLNLKAGYKAS